MALTASPEAARLRPLAFADLRGWDADDHAAAFTAFRRSAAAAVAMPPKARPLGPDPEALVAVARLALAFAGDIDPATARRFFETWFTPHELEPASGSPFFTGYYEPEVDGAATRRPGFAVPLYRRPDDLVDVEDGTPGLPGGYRFARRTATGLAPYHDRAAIEGGALAGRGLELAWLADPVDAFFVHIQGSARIRLAEGGVMRVTYAAKSGQPYTPVGRVIADRAGMPRAEVTMAVIRRWLAENPKDAAAVMQENRSFIFFREAPVDDPVLGPVAAAGVPVTPGRSIAVDRTLLTFHAPVWVETTLPGRAPWRRLAIAADTGSAIVGPGRADIFFGSGEEAGAIAGAMRAGGRFVLLLPRPGAAP